ncbi:hypothetical protein ACH5RR_037059 [Cinchona calisaya]|uniref:NAC domain-containing protein n=1 Tax=Cinchona calisaya TaxID=153742 RepID=A0ABD2Y6K3_9GENT
MAFVPDDEQIIKYVLDRLKSHELRSSNRVLTLNMTLVDDDSINDIDSDDEEEITDNIGAMVDDDGCDKHNFMHRNGNSTRLGSVIGETSEWIAKDYFEDSVRIPSFSFEVRPEDFACGGKTSVVFLGCQMRP